MTDKRWTYNQITLATEKSIRNSIKLSQQAAHEGKLDVARIFQGYAFGKFSLWNELTIGWQNDGDAERLEALAESAKPAG